MPMAKKNLMVFISGSIKRPLLRTWTKKVSTFKFSDRKSDLEREITMQPSSFWNCFSHRGDLEENVLGGNKINPSIPSRKPRQKTQTKLHCIESVIHVELSSTECKVQEKKEMWWDKGKSREEELPQERSTTTLMAAVRVDASQWQGQCRAHGSLWVEKEKAGEEEKVRHGGKNEVSPSQ